ncbi:hypothetical protein GGR50DRAFT_691583 [Xylaria sp. CBS 124048]|nr:hypothetical protein GGR50DRAFT_691583 [Xylaria sp. CBS 124048]
MAPSIEALQEGLKDATRQLYATDPDSVTVNAVRQRAEEQNGLERGFFAAVEWKARSKILITDFVQKLMMDDFVSSPEPEVKENAKSAKNAKNATKRSSSDELCPSLESKRKRTVASASKGGNSKSKKQLSSSPLSQLSDSDDEVDTEQPKKAVAQKQSSDSELTDFDSSEYEDETTKKAKQSATSRKAAKESESELSDIASSEDEPKTSKLAKQSAASQKAEKQESESELSDVGDSEDEPKPAKSRAKASKLENSKDINPAASRLKRKQQNTTKKQDAKRSKIESGGADDLGAGNKVDKTEANAHATIDGDNPTKNNNPERGCEPLPGDSDSSLSSVFDEPLPQKRKGKQAKGASKAKPAAPKELSGDEAEIKKLQGQLVKCGVRKIWGVELKKFGTDSKAKIRHLKDMLHDAGMDGRFSEAKARELKEKRELMGELEAVNEMNERWGLEAHGRRTLRGKSVRKTATKEPNNDQKADDDEEEPMNNGDNEQAKTETNPRVSKRMADLAFLGSDSESE